MAVEDGLDQHNQRLAVGFRRLAQACASRTNCVPLHQLSCFRCVLPGFRNAPSTGAWRHGPRLHTSTTGDWTCGTAARWRTARPFTQLEATRAQSMVIRVAVATSPAASPRQVPRQLPPLSRTAEAWGTSALSNKVQNAGVQNPVAPASNSVHTSRMTLKMKQLRSVDSGSAVSSVVEHFLDTEGVRGSNPLSRTIFRGPCSTMPES